MVFLPAVSFPTGAYHASELQYLFKLSNVLNPPRLDAAQQALSRDMVGYWARFAGKHDPNGDGRPVWPRYTVDRESVQTLDQPRPTTLSGFASEHRCEPWP
jgi:para-nitrobenzyl esterase